ncbi:MAG TPA: winged helix-turn-helix transcriptional regulator [Solirubrobacterales bacterium]|nr:winged helix-turn-helix transcriptional regulator [Solirubrobacterales bacterium]
MTANTVNGSGNGARSGAHTLVLLGAPLNVLILQSLQDGPKLQSDLLRRTNTPAQSTLRTQLKRLDEIGAIEKHRRNRFPGVLEHELTAGGHDLLSVMAALEAWLAKAPEGALALDGSAAKAPIKALAEGWSTTMLRALAAGPLSLTDLDRIIGSLSYPTLERRLAALRLANLVEARTSNGRSTPYGVTEWLRQGIAPLGAAARWERRYLPETTAPIGRLDVEAAFLLAVPLLEPPADLSGTCRLAVEIPNGGERRLAGVMIEMEDSTITTCATRLRVDADAWALGSPTAWLDAVVDCDTARLELGGNRRLVDAVIGGLHGALFGSLSQIHR